MKQKPTKIIVVSLLLMLLSACQPALKPSDSESELNATSVHSSVTSETTSTVSSEPITYFNISWFDERGTLLETTTVIEDTLPSYTYNVSDTLSHKRVFQGWATTLGGPVSSVEKASKDTSYFAVVSETLRTYSVTFVTNSDSVIEPFTVNYGSSVNEPAKPVREGYRFMGWTLDLSANDAVEWPLLVTTNITLYAMWNAQVGIKGYLEALLAGYELNPYLYIPEAMRPDYAPNLVDINSVSHDYTTSVNTSAISEGFGEQWAMVLTNINQSMIFFNALSVVESLVGSSVTLFNDYLDKNPDDFARHEFKIGTYQVFITYDELMLTYILSYNVKLPLIGQVNAEIALSLNTETGERVGRIQLGAANALRYVMNENSYTLALRYGGIRRAYFSVSRDAEENITGAIFETLGIDGKFNTISAAQFFVHGDYVSVVGNKAQAFIGFSGTINELYHKNEGKLLGFEVRETLSSIRYNTLWFNFSALSGINSIRKMVDDKHVISMYLNDASAAFKTKLVGGLSGKTLSRRYDIEMRTHYYSSYDTENALYVVSAVETPMFFVQAEMLENVVKDVKDNNSYLENFALVINETTLHKILSDYATLVDDFIIFKATFTIDDILAFVGEAYLGA